MNRRLARKRFDLLVRALEPRVLLSVTPAGPEFQVNTYTPNAQAAPATAMDGDGDFVMAGQFGRDLAPAAPSSVFGGNAIGELARLEDPLRELFA